MARLAGSFDAISHDVNQPWTRRFRPDSATSLRRRRWRSCSREPRWHGRSRRKTVLRSGFGLFSDLLPGSVVDLVGANPPYSQDFPGRSAGHRGRNGDRAGSSRQRRRCDRRRQSDVQLGLRARPALLRVAARQSGHLPSADRDHRRSRWQAARALLHAVELRAGAADRRHAQSAGAVRRHARGQPALHDAGERLSDGLPGLLRAVPLRQPDRSAIRRRDAIEHRREQPLQRPAIDSREAAGARHCKSRRTTPGATAWIPCQTADSCRSPREGFFRRFPAILQRHYGPCDYDVRHNFTAQYVYQLPVKFRGRCLADALNGWQVSGTAFWHSGLPFSVLSAPYSANGNGIVQGQRPAIRQRRSRRAALRAQSDSRRDAARHDPVAEPERVRLDRRSQHRRLHRRRHSAELPVWQSGPQRSARSRFRLERSVSHQMVPADGARKTAHRRPVFQRFQSSEFRPAVERDMRGFRASLPRRPDSAR